ncbi:MAG: hypothetical protein JSR19_05340 [Proteobacteria bacterium]|nr:hypothetical protein [Pseudomonadota bacterium]HQR03992.1 hypothetical protein [Rhodocyclaceae bacterium]
MLLILTGLVAGGAWMGAQFSPRQPATVALDVGLSMIRLAVPFLMLVQIQDLVAREVERRLILNSLTYPRSRAAFLLARYAAIVTAAWAVTWVLALVLGLVVVGVGKTYAQATPVALGAPYLAVVTACCLDFAVVAAFAALAASVATTPNLVLFSGLGFMIAARSVSVIITLLSREQELVTGAQWYHQGLQSVQWFLPDLAALDIRAVALYGKWAFLPTPVWGLAVMPLAYSCLAVSLACLAFERRQFA